MNECRFRVSLAGNRRLFPADHGVGSSPTLDSSGPVKALCRALATLPPNFSDKLIHHSDRGGQYCSSLYTGILKEHGIQVERDTRWLPLR
ncbi:MAG: hypothetical protein V8R91_04005 [Butyricimonas faecihominis]